MLVTPNVPVQQRAMTTVDLARSWWPVRSNKGLSTGICARYPEEGFRFIGDLAEGLNDVDR